MVFYKKDKIELLSNYRGEKMKRIITALILISSFMFGQTPDLVINEILADPASDLSGDSNGDGTRDASEDEFVEIINNETTIQDLSGFTLSDAFGVRHTFPANTKVQPGESIVVFGGGTPTNIYGVVQTASSGLIGLNNSGDNVILASGSTIIASFTYGSEGGDNQSLGRNPDITGSFEKHSTFAPSGSLFSPGKRNDNASPLPVELTTFTASLSDQNVELNWETATEVNNYGFEVERASTPLSMNSSQVQTRKWIKLDFVNGHGNSNSPKYYSYSDNEVEVSGKYVYRLKQIDIDGTFEYSDEVEVNLGTPNNFELNQNYPNPFNPTTSIKFNIPQDSQVRLIVFNILGEEVAELLNENCTAGYHTVNFDASLLNSGIYFYKLETNNFTQIRKMMLIK